MCVCLWVCGCVCLMGGIRWACVCVCVVCGAQVEISFWLFVPSGIFMLIERMDEKASDGSRKNDVCRSSLQLKWFRTSQDDVQIDNSMIEWKGCVCERARERERKSAFDALNCSKRILGHTLSDITHVSCGCNILEWFQKACRFTTLIHPSFPVCIPNVWVCVCTINADAQASNTRPNRTAPHNHTHLLDPIERFKIETNESFWQWFCLQLPIQLDPFAEAAIACVYWSG